MDAIIYDFDGVIADSEVLANQVLAACVSDLGLPTTLRESYAIYMGKRFGEVIAEIEARLGRPVPAGFPQTYQARTLQALREQLQIVPGARGFIARYAHLPMAIASSSQPDRLRLGLDLLGLTRRFGGRVFSAVDMPRGKPHPDIYLHAAAQLGVAPQRCLVIEDSPSGVRAGVAAGMRVAGLTAARHIGPGHAARLRHAGAHAIAPSFASLHHIAAKMF